LPNSLEKSTKPSSNKALRIDPSLPPARKVVTRSPHRSVGLMACAWLQDKAIEYESQLERRFLQKALVFPYIKQITHQPFKIEYEDNGKQLEYTPDFLCTFKDGCRVVVEVKPAKFVEKNRFKLTAGKRILQESDIPFFVATDQHIDQGKSSQTAALLIRYARGHLTEMTRLKCLEFISNSDTPVTYKTLLETGIANEADIMHLIGRGELTIPSCHLDSDTLLSTPMRTYQNAILLFCSWFDITPW